MGMPEITPSTTTRPQAITDIIESVALEQTALSHILNAEGEKLQKIVAIATTTQQLLDVNKSVECMVNSVSRLEMVLQSKLELFGDCLCPPTSSTSSTTTTTTTSTTTTTTTTTCAPVTNVAINPNFTDPSIEVFRNDSTSFIISNNAASQGSFTFTVVPTPSGEAVAFTTVPTGVTTSGNTFTINFATIPDGTIVFTVGSGSCKQTMSVYFQTAA